ncbi:MAG: metalloregulator ArsR/SmtB family transcription factor [Bacilli bacterium]|nr:metalloregulator ArsR/SmtB family transcription factor [Bacilli bacterium]
MIKEKVVKCECTIIHNDIVEKTRKEMPKDETLYDLAEIFKIFGDSTRIKILYSLFKNEMCVCDISALIGTTQSAISHQLRLLKQAKLVKYRKDGKIVYYSLDDSHVKSIFNEGLRHIEEN